jgi:hypothetical protein
MLILHKDVFVYILNKNKFKLTNSLKLKQKLSIRQQATLFLVLDSKTGLDIEEILGLI